MKKVELSGSIHSGEFAPIGYSVKGSLITFNLTLPLLGAGKGGDTIVRVWKSFELQIYVQYLTVTNLKFVHILIKSQIQSLF